MTKESGWQRYSFREFSNDVDAWSNGKKDTDLYSIFIQAVNEGKAQIKELVMQK